MTNESEDKVLFDFEIDEAFSYKIQHETIIIWKSKESDPLLQEEDSAISFQVKEGLIEICKELNSILGRDPFEYSIKQDFSDENLFELTIANLPFIAKKILPVSLIILRLLLIYY